MYAAIPLAGSRFPGDTAAGRFGETACSEALTGRVEPARLEALEMRHLPPNAVRWRLGGATCCACSARATAAPSPAARQRPGSGRTEQGLGYLQAP